jgi:hypothetical protein
MTAYHSKRGPVEGCPQPDEPIRERAWADGQKADMHREAFEKWFDVEHAEHTQQTPGGRGYVQLLKGRAWRVWQAAMRYRDEQEKQA